MRSVVLLWFYDDAVTTKGKKTFSVIYSNISFCPNGNGEREAAWKTPSGVREESEMWIQSISCHKRGFIVTGPQREQVDALPWKTVIIHMLDTRCSFRWARGEKHCCCVWLDKIYVLALELVISCRRFFFCCPSAGRPRCTSASCHNI